MENKLRDLVFEVLSNYQDKDIRNENIKLQIATDIETKWKNYVKEVAKKLISQKAIESIQNRFNGIIKP